MRGNKGEQINSIEGRNVRLRKRQAIDSKCEQQDKE